MGLYGIIIASFLFAIIVLFILKTVSKKAINSFDDLIGNNKIIKFVDEMFLLICFCIMIAGIGAFFEEQFEISHWLGALIGSAICFLVFSYKYKGLEIFNTVLVPFIIIGIIFISIGRYDLNTFDKIKYTLQGFTIPNFLLSSILYVGYNSLVLIPILIKLKQYSLSDKQKNIIAVGVFSILCIVGVLLYNVINLFFPKIMVFELPTLKLASMLGDSVGFIFGFIILFAIFTTAISCGFALLEMNEKYYMIKSIIICLIGFILSNYGFSHLVNLLFPIFGYVGVAEIIYIIVLVTRKNRSYLWVK